MGSSEIGMNTMRVVLEVVQILLGKKFNITAIQHRWQKGWGYGAAALPDFKDAPCDFNF